MKWLVLIAMTLISTVSLAQDREGGIHTDTYCSATNQKTCAHLKFEKWPTSIEASSFLVHIMSPSNAQVENVSVKLWMDMNGHGHGSSPVKLDNADELNHFFVQDAYFVMRGTWQVVINFTDAGIAEKIIVPVTIKE